MVLTSAPFLRVGAKSHVGNVRSENQDLMSRFTSPFGEVFIVADGMGGHQGGETAAQMTVEGFDRELRNAPPQSSVADALMSAAQRTNERIYELANSDDPTIAKMGSTVVLAVINGNQMWVGHAGDSRAYLYREGKLARLTKDHSMVQKMIDHEMLTEEQARDHPDASVINRAFGQQPELELEVSGPMEVLPGDGVLLCTDGLSGYVVDEKIAIEIARYPDAQEITAALIDLALDAGGEDNVTVQYLLFTPTGEQAQGLIETNLPPPPSPPSRSDKVNRSPKAKPPEPSASPLIILLIGMLLGFFLAAVVFIGVPRILARLQKEEPQAEATPSPSPEPSRVEASPSPEPSKETAGQSSESSASPSPSFAGRPTDRESPNEKPSEKPGEKPSEKKDTHAAPSTAPVAEPASQQPQGDKKDPPPTPSPSPAATKPLNKRRRR